MIYWTMFDLENEHYTIATTNKGLCFLGNDFAQREDFLAYAKKKGWRNIEENPEKLAKPIAELQAYFTKERQQFKLPLDLIGTPFQQQVWEALQAVPYGETITYSDVAEQIGKKESVRAVANAIGANPVMIIVPCHRIIGKNGKLTGFRGGLDLKQKLLVLEGVTLL